MNATWPATRFYWSVLELPAGHARVKVGSAVPPGILAAIEDDLPAPIEDLWAVAVPGDDSTVIVCAVRRTDLATLDPGTDSLTPESVPEFVHVAPERFNLLIGEYEPKGRRRARVRASALAAATVLLCAGLIGVGLERRASSWIRHADDARTAARAAVASIAPNALWSRDDLELELLQRRQTVPVDLKPPGDASQALGSLIARWPTDTPSKAQSITATSESASIAVTVPGDPASFLAKLSAPEGWKLEEPRLTAIDKATRLSLELRKGAKEDAP